MTRFRYFLLLAVLLPQLNAQAQCRLLYHVQDLANTPNGVVADSANYITYIEPRGSLSHKLIVHYAHTKRELIDRRQIWGYVDGVGRTWRCYGTDDFRIVAYNGHWVEYQIIRSTTSRNGSVLMNQYRLYSHTLESPVRNQWNDAMADAPAGFVVGPTQRQ